MLRPALLAILSVCCAGANVLAAQPRYTAAWTDGSQSQGDDLSDWHEDQAQPKLDGRLLFEAANPVRWLRDNSLAPLDAPRAFVEFVGGDRLPGRVAGFRRGLEAAKRGLPPHLLVEPTVGLDWPEATPRAHLRVISQSLRRVVWHKRGSDRYEPGTVFFRDGRQLTFRSLRWDESLVRLLVADGATEAAFSDIAELHMPAAEPWEAYYAQVAVLSPNCRSLLMRLEYQGGLIATSSMERFHTRSLGGPAGQLAPPESWLHVIQPAWSLDPFYLRHRQVRLRRYFAPHEPPLSWLDPAASQQQSRLAASRGWRADQNVQGGPLRSGGAEFGWGFGVHAQHQFVFELPAGARRFRARLGLDVAAGGGGCARGLVYLNRADSSPLFAGPVMVGSAATFDTGWLPLAADAANGERSLVLVADAVETDRPQGADPLDIRDLFDWLEPQLELDPAVLVAELAKRQLPRLVAWNGWQVTGGAAAVRWANIWQPEDPGAGSYRVCALPAATSITLSQRLRIEAGQDCLVMAVERNASQASAGRIDVQVDGEPSGSFEVPPGGGKEPDPLVVYLQPFRGRDVTIDVTQTASDERSWVDWRTLNLAPRPARLFRLFEDEPRFVAAMSEGDGELKLIDDEVYSGTDSVRLARGARASANLAGLKVPIRYNPQAGEYRYLRFAWRKRGGGRIGMQLRRADNPDADRAADEGPPPSLRYEAGRSDAPPGDALRLYTEELPDQWFVVTRDLYADFGAFHLTGLSLEAPDGQYALFDHIYLARSLDDFKWAEAELSAERIARRLARLRRWLPAETDDPAEARRMIQAFAPGFTAEPLGPTGLALVKTFQQRPAVLRTQPVSLTEPLRLTGNANVPWGRTTRLLLSAAHETYQPWRLVVKANGVTLHNGLVGPETSREGWLDLSVDLSRFAGQKFGVALELECHSYGEKTAPAYWGQIELVSE